VTGRAWKKLASMIAGIALAAGTVRGEPPPPTMPPGSPSLAVPLTPGARVATGQAPVVGGNAAGARERALDEAMRQAVDLALGDLADAPMRAAQAKAVRAIEAKARNFVPRYRTLEEGEANGVYTVRIEAEVDDVALRRRIDTWTETSPAAAPPPPGTPGLLIVPGDRLASTSAFMASLVAALSSSNVRARAAEAGGDFTVATAARAAARASLGNAALVSAIVTDEGALRGTGRVATACRGTARLLAARSAAVVSERAASARVFTNRADAGHTSCLERLARDLGDQLVAAVSVSIGLGSADLRVLTLDADVVEPQAVTALLKSVRSVGAVSAAELQRVSAGRVEIRVRTRAQAGPLAAALSRDADALIVLSDVQSTADAIRLTARLRAPISPQPGSSP
jgi:hypothetical protein